MKRSATAPATAKDQKIAVRHLAETIQIAKDHAAEHRAVATKPGYSRKYNIDHAKVHEQGAAKDQVLLAKRRAGGDPKGTS
jgi:hypothetical protein